MQKFMSQLFHIIITMFEFCLSLFASTVIATVFAFIISQSIAALFNNSTITIITGLAGGAVAAVHSFKLCMKGCKL